MAWRGSRIRRQSADHISRSALGSSAWSEGARRTLVDEVGVGTLLGSNVFNGLFVVGIAAMVTPIPIGGPAFCIALVAAAIALAAVWPGTTQILGRGRGVLLIFIYALMMALLAVFAS